MSKNTFTIEFNDKYTRMCDLDVKNGKLEILSLGFDDTAPNYFASGSDALIEKQAEIITTLHKNLQIKKKQVNVIIPDLFTFSQILDMPRLKEKELIAAIRYQADEFIPLPIDDVYLDLEILKDDPRTKKLSILIVASAKRLVDQIYKTLEKANLVPESLENELSAMGRMVSDVLQFRGEAVLILNFGYSQTSLYAIDEQTSLMNLSRTFKVGYELFLRDVKVNLNWDDQKTMAALRSIGFNTNGSVQLKELIAPLTNELFQEMEKFMILTKDKFNQQTKRIFIYNSDTRIAGFAKLIQDKFGIPVQPFPIAPILLPNPVTQSFGPDISTFISVIAGQLR